MSLISPTRLFFCRYRICKDISTIKNSHPKLSD